MGNIGATEILLILFLLFFMMLFPLIAIISILKNRFKDNDKIVWTLVVIFLPIIGPILYFIIGSFSKLKEI